MKVSRDEPRGHGAAGINLQAATACVSTGRGGCSWWQVRAHALCKIWGAVLGARSSDPVVRSHLERRNYNLSNQRPCRPRRCVCCEAPRRNAQVVRRIAGEARTASMKPSVRRMPSSVCASLRKLNLFGKWLSREQIPTLSFAIAFFILLRFSSPAHPLQLLSVHWRLATTSGVQLMQCAAQTIGPLRRQCRHLNRHLSWSVLRPSLRQPVTSGTFRSFEIPAHPVTAAAAAMLFDRTQFTERLEVIALRIPKPKCSEYMRKFRG